MATEVEILREALERIKAKSEMWQQAAQSTASAKAVPPWWNLGDIAASALKKAAQPTLASDGGEALQNYDPTPDIERISKQGLARS
jgi:hypothetical protein